MASAVPVPPREDPWYQAPSGYDTAKPGTVLRVRVAPGQLLQTFSSASAVYNILFSTTDSNYQPSWAVTTLLIPATTDAHALLSYHIPYNTTDVNASPSFLIHRVSSDYWGELIDNVQWALGQGWYVNLADHEGPYAAVGDGLVAGHVTLDSIRSVLVAGFGLRRESVKVGLWGYSGGALAAGWAAEVQPHYAPELTLNGAALGGMPPDILCVANSSGTVFAGQVPLLLLGITTLSPLAYQEVLSFLKPEHKDKFLAIHNQDVRQVFESFANQNIYDCFTNGREILQQPLLRKVLRRKGLMGHHGAPLCPLFIYKSIVDEISPIADTDKLVKSYQEADANILYERNTVGSHMAEAEFRKEGARKWISTILDGQYTHTGCTITDVTIGGPDLK